MRVSEAKTFRLLTPLCQRQKIKMRQGFLQISTLSYFDQGGIGGRKVLSTPFCPFNENVEGLPKGNFGISRHIATLSGSGTKFVGMPSHSSCSLSASRRYRSSEGQVFSPLKSDRENPFKEDDNWINPSKHVSENEDRDISYDPRRSNASQKRKYIDYKNSDQFSSSSTFKNRVRENNPGKRDSFKGERNNRMGYRGGNRERNDRIGYREGNRRNKIHENYKPFSGDGFRKNDLRNSPVRRRFEEQDEDYNFYENDEPTIGSLAYQLRRDAKEEGMDLLYGVQVVANALAINKRDSREIFIQEGLSLREKKDKVAIQKIFDLVDMYGIKKTYIPKHELNIMTDNRPHQGFVLRTSEMKFIDIRDATDIKGKNVANVSGDKDREHWLALDEVWDPQNLGALIRSSYFLGIKGIIVCSKNSANLSATVSKASAGAMELMSERLFAAKNMVKFLQSCKEEGYEVIGTSLDSDSVELSEVDTSKPSIIVLGNEGSGLRTNVKRECTTNVKILGTGADTSSENSDSQSGSPVDSLNVSVTGGILMHHFINM